MRDACCVAARLAHRATIAARQSGWCAWRSYSRQGGATLAAAPAQKDEVLLRAVGTGPPEDLAGATRMGRRTLPNQVTGLRAPAKVVASEAESIRRSLVLPAHGHDDDDTPLVNAPLAAVFFLRHLRISRYRTQLPPCPAAFGFFYRGFLRLHSGRSFFKMSGWMQAVFCVTIAHVVARAQSRCFPVGASPYGGCASTLAFCQGGARAPASALMPLTGFVKFDVLVPVSVAGALTAKLCPASSAVCARVLPF